MKINYDYYNGKDLYCDGEIEKTIIDYIDNNDEKEYDKIFEKDISWPVFYHLTSIRQNILNWYPFKKDAAILEIGGGMGAITGVLCDKAKKVISVELSKQRATAIGKRHKDRENLEIIVGNLNDIKFNEKFDYITLIGVFEYSISFTKDEKPYHKFLENIKKLLKPNGKILIAIENKFGIKYFAGAGEDHTNVIFDSITGYKNNNSVRTFGREEILNILSEVGFNNNKFYYPLPDYKLPNVIFSDSSLPDENNINTYYPYYYEDSDILFNEIEVYKSIIKENKEHFKLFSNSFFIECSLEKNINDVDNVIFNNYNKIQFRDFKVNNIIKSDYIDNIDFKSDKIDTCMYNFWTRKYKDMLSYKTINNMLKDNNILIEKENVELQKQKINTEEEKLEVEKENKVLFEKNSMLQKLVNEKENLLNDEKTKNAMLLNNLSSILDSRTYKIVKPLSKIYNKLFSKNNKD